MSEDKNKVVVSAKVKREIRRKIEQIAARRNRSVSFVTEELLEKALTKKKAA